MNKSADHYAAWLNNYPFEVMITIRIPPNIPPDLARKKITQNVLGPLSRFLNNQLAVIGVIVPKTDTEQQHAHCLALSKDQELYLSSPEAQAHLRSLRNTITSHDAAIDFEAVIDAGAAAYVADHMIRDGSEIFSYNQRLLDSHKITGGFKCKKQS